MSTTSRGLSRAGVAVVALAGLALASYAILGGAFLLVATAALVVALLARHGTPRTGRTTRRTAGWITGTVVALPLVFGLLVALGGAMSEDFGSEDGPDEQSSTLATGELTREDLTGQVRAALERQGHTADAIDCPAHTGTGSDTRTSYECTGSVGGWERVVVNLHQQGQFTVVGIDTEP